jgi:sigma-E factor negative regulatory protein RseA
MNEKVSALMDGELEDREAAVALETLRSGSEERISWHAYHVIGDAMRETRMVSAGFSARFAARLAEEPTVLAPRPQRSARPFLGERRWQWLSAAASLAAIAFVSVAYFSQEPPPAAPVAAVEVPPQAEVVQVAPPESAGDYLLAHQNYSPRTSLPGIAPYVRTVSTESRGPRQ